MKNKDVFLKLLNLKPENCIHEEFDFSHFNIHFNRALENNRVLNCGSVGCLLGELPGIDSNWSFNKLGSLELNIGVVNPFFAASEYFGLPHDLICFFFSPDSIYFNPLTQKTYRGLTSRASLKEVQNNIKKFMKHSAFEHFFQE